MTRVVRNTPIIVAKIGKKRISRSSLPRYYWKPLWPVTEVSKARLVQSQVSQDRKKNRIFFLMWPSHPDVVLSRWSHHPRHHVIPGTPLISSISFHDPCLTSLHFTSMLHYFTSISFTSLRLPVRRYTSNLFSSSILDMFLHAFRLLSASKSSTILRHFFLRWTFVD